MLLQYRSLMGSLCKMDITPSLALYFMFISVKLGLGPDELSPALTGPLVRGEDHAVRSTAHFLLAKQTF